MPEPTEGPTVLRILLGTQLRRLRESRGITAQAAARAIRGSESKISRIELGRNAIREIDVLDLLTFYGVGAVGAGAAAEPGRAGQPPRAGGTGITTSCPTGSSPTSGWRRPRPRSASTSRSSYRACCRRRRYTAAVLAMCDIPIGEAERHVILRKERQRRFTEGRLRLWAIVEETALRRPIGSTRDPARPAPLPAQPQQQAEPDPADHPVRHGRPRRAQRVHHPAVQRARTFLTWRTWNTSPVLSTSTRKPTSTATCWPWNGSAS